MENLNSVNASKSELLFTFYKYFSTVLISQLVLFTGDWEENSCGKLVSGHVRGCCCC